MKLHPVHPFVSLDYISWFLENVSQIANLLYYLALNKFEV